MEDCVAPELRNAALKVMSQPGFFKDLPPMEGAIKAVEEMVERGFAILICTSPLPSNPTCPQDKVEWVRKHLGHIEFRQPGDAKKRLDPQDIIVMTRDKTFVMGDVLIDDKPVNQRCSSAGFAARFQEELISTLWRDRSQLYQHRFL